MFENVKIARDLEEILRNRPEIKQVRVIEVLKGGAKNHVCIAEIDGVKVVAKRFLETGAAQTVLSLQAELDFVAAQLGHGRNRINECLFAFPDQGVAVLTFAPGERLGAQLMNAKGSARAALIEHSGDWLGAYTAGRRRTGSFAPRHWLRQLARLGHCRTEDQPLLDTLHASLETQAQCIQGAQVTHAATHGDYVSLNAHYYDGVIYGVDIQGESWLPLAKDIAGFLVWEGVRRPSYGDDLRFGLAQQDLRGFLSGVPLPDDEAATILPFMIGLQFYRRVIERSKSQKGMEHVGVAVKNYISTIDAVGRS